jgi:hypothetical protein
MQIHEKYNTTCFVTDFGFCLDRDGMEYAVAVLKATFHFTDSGGTFIPERRQMAPVYKQDVYRDQPDNSSLLYPADIVHTKQGTDVILNGHAYARDRKSVTAGFRLGAMQKQVLVSGPRHWDDILGLKSIIGPAPFDRLALTYENAYGGCYEEPGHGCRRFAANPVGLGFGTKNMSCRPLPCLEYPEQRITAVSQTPLPAAFNAVAPWWQQRTRYCGTFDQTWHDTRRPLLPQDFDERYYNTVPADQISRDKLKGGEQLFLNNVHPRQASLNVIIPRHRFRAVFRIKEQTQATEMAIDTLVVEPDDNRLLLSYRSSVAIGHDIKFLKSIHFEAA